MTEKPKYPKYTREQNRACKLTDSEITSIPILRAKGYTNKRIAQMFSVSANTISRWLLSPEERKRRNKESYQKNKHLYKKLTLEEKAKLWRDTKKRKQKLYPEKFKTWKNQTEIQSAHRKTPKWQERYAKEQLKIS